MSNEYVSVKDKGLALVEGKSVRVVGSLSDVFCNLLNDVYRDRQQDKKRSHVSFENNHDLSIINTVYNNISKEDDSIVYVSNVSNMDDEFLKSITTDLQIGDKTVHLITAVTNDNTTIDEEKEELKDIVQLESYVLERKGRVYRVVLGE